MEGKQGSGSNIITFLNEHFNENRNKNVKIKNNFKRVSFLSLYNLLPGTSQHRIKRWLILIIALENIFWMSA